MLILICSSFSSTCRIGYNDIGMNYSYMYSEQNSKVSRITYEVDEIFDNNDGFAIYYICSYSIYFMEDPCEHHNDAIHCRKGMLTYFSFLLGSASTVRIIYIYIILTVEADPNRKEK